MLHFDPSKIAVSPAFPFWVSDLMKGFDGLRIPAFRLAVILQVLSMDPKPVIDGSLIFKTATFGSIDQSLAGICMEERICFKRFL